MRVSKSVWNTAYDARLDDSVAKVVNSVSDASSQKIRCAVRGAEGHCANLSKAGNRVVVIHAAHAYLGIVISAC